MYGGVSLFIAAYNRYSINVKLKTIHTDTYTYVCMYILYVFIYGYIQRAHWGNQGKAAILLSSLK